MKKLISKYRDLPDSDFGALVKMMDDYEKTGKAETNNRNMKFLFYSQVKKEIDNILKERERKRGSSNG